MAVIHRTTLVPSKLDILAAWLPGRPWYRGDTPDLVRAGGFRLDDPGGEVGMELLIAVDAADPSRTTYFVPMTYRGAPLDGADHALVGTMDHGMLGHRWAYDGCHDPVLVAALVALIAGRVAAQHQDVSNTPAPDVVRGGTIHDVHTVDASSPVDGPDDTTVPLAGDVALRVRRVLVPDDAEPTDTIGWVRGPWTTPDAAPVAGTLAVLR